MAPGVLFCTGLLALALLSQPVESCFPRFIEARVPVKVNPGYNISQVHLGSCRREGLRLISGDPDFTVRSDGTLHAVRVTRVTQQRSFSVWVREAGGQPSRIAVHLTPDTQQRVDKAPWEVARKRSKRRWSPPPFSIIENDLPPFPKVVEQVGSDSSVNHTVYYTIQGQGVTLTPVNLFSVDRNTGVVSVHYAVDREQYPEFTFEAQVFDRITGKQTDRPLDIIVLVDDINDNAPTFTGPLEFHVEEQCSVGTQVGVVTATDRDQEETLHSKIKFSLLTGAELFSIHPSSGMISARSSALDREVQAVIAVTVEIKDMNGASNGLFNTATATITLVDINDNAPTFRETTYKAKIEENRADLLVLRIPVDDRDEEKTKNWNAKFVITEGNENGNFRIETDPVTNEGLLYVIKPLDYEKGQVVKLRVSAQNEAPLAGPAGSSWLSIPVELSVGDVDEGPEFHPGDLVLRVKENLPNGTLLGTYVALDPETKSSEGMRYYKVSDPGSWVSLDEDSGQLTVANIIDRESPLVTNATYKIHVMAVDASGKSGNGTVTLLIDDVNDNVPVVVPGLDLVVCEEDEDRKMGSVVIHAVDADLSPYSAPFHFQLADGHDGRWRIRDATNTSAVLEQAVDMPRGVYEVPVLISDLQSRGEVQVLNVRVCRCLGDQCVAHRSSVTFGAWGVLAMLLGLLLLLLLCIFFVFACSTKGDKIYMDDNSGGMLLKSNTEAPGEEVKSPNLLLIPSSGLDGVDGSVKGGSGGLWEQKTTTLMTGQTLIDQQQTQQSIYDSSRRDFVTGQGQSNLYWSGHYGTGGGGGVYSDSTLYRQSNMNMLHTWATNGLYLDKKLEYFVGESEDRYADDLLRAYGYEGEGSPAGSVGCCSDLGDQDNLDFLDTLDSKFKRLANICMERGDEED